VAFDVAASREKIDRVEYEFVGPVTLCVITLQNRFAVTGQSVCPPDIPLDPDKGKRLAWRSAFSKFLQLERYLAHSLQQHA